MNKIQILKLVVSLLLPLGLGAIAGMLTSQSVPNWFANLAKPPFNPPNWIFGSVWTALYILMGISLFLIWKEDASKIRRLAILVFMIQLLLNFGWSFIFFYFKMIGLAFVEIILLWISVIAMFILFYKIKPIAAYMNIPYILWVSFAMVLNGAFFFLNRR